MFEGARGVKICIGVIDTGQYVTIRFLLYFIKILIVNDETMEKRCHQAVMDAQ